MSHEFHNWCYQPSLLSAFLLVQAPNDSLITQPGRKDNILFLKPSNLGFNGEMETSNETSISLQNYQTITWFSVFVRRRQLSWNFF